MRFWFEHSSSVSLREQVVAQITLGILSGDLAPGERLPSIRELSRRFDLHANTVSAGYRQLGFGLWPQASQPTPSSCVMLATSIGNAARTRQPLLSVM